MATIYCIQNMVDNKRYIGKTVQRVKNRWLTHIHKLSAGVHVNIHLQHAWSKHGADNFEFSILEDNISEEDILKREGYWIQYYNTLDNNYGYNLVRPDENGVNRYSEEVKRRMSDARKGEKSYWYGRRGSNNPNYGLRRSVETKQKLSDAKKGENNPNYGKRGSDMPMYGKRHSDKSKQKMSEAHSGEKAYMYGKHHSEETKQKISDAKRGENNPNAKLTEQDVVNVIGLLRKERSCKEIAKILGAPEGIIGDIKRKKSWKWVWDKLENKQ